MLILENCTIFSADDEEPKCERCDSCNADYDYCCNWCGSEHGWHGYRRTKYNKEN